MILAKADWRKTRSNVVPLFPSEPSGFEVTTVLLANGRAVKVRPFFKWLVRLARFLSCRAAYPASINMCRDGWFGLPLSSRCARGAPAACRGFFCASCGKWKLLHLRHALLHKGGLLLYRDFFAHRPVVARAHFPGVIARQHPLRRRRFHACRQRGRRKPERAEEQAEYNHNRGARGGLLSWTGTMIARLTKPRQVLTLPYTAAPSGLCPCGGA